MKHESIMQSLKTLKNKGSRKFYNAIHVGESYFYFK